jgi:2-polyprenyl-3-methyl-5-hydroxy-6-metoxy-1,4-benzoquinol methylase
MTCPLCESSFAADAHVRWVKDGYDVVRCPSCGLLFRRDLPTQAELDSIYGLAYFDGAAGGDPTGYLDYTGDADLHRRAAQRRLALMDEAVGSTGRLLDVGAAAGFFVEEARARGWDATGLDVSEPMVRWGRENLGVSLEVGTLSSTELPNGSLDALTMWDYIEHSIDPIGDVRRARDILKVDGVLCLSTGDAAAFVARLSGSRWHLLTPRHHNFFFTATTLTRLLEDNGFRVVTLDHRAGQYPISYLAHKLRTLVDWRALETLTRRLTQARVGSVAIPVNLWDIATVVARRTA